MTKKRNRSLCRNVRPRKSILPQQSSNIHKITHIIFYQFDIIAFVMFGGPLRCNESCPPLNWWSIQVSHVWNLRFTWTQQAINLSLILFMCPEMCRLMKKKMFCLKRVLFFLQYQTFRVLLQFKISLLYCLSPPKRHGRHLMRLASVFYAFMFRYDETGNSSLAPVQQSK